MDRRNFTLSVASLFALAPLAKAADTVLLNYTQDALNGSFNQELWASNAKRVVATYSAASEEVRKKFPPKTISYGKKAGEKLDIFAPKGAKKLPVVVFIHGGGWQQLSKNEASAPAQTFIQNGCVYVALNFDAIPKVDLGGVIDQCRQAMRWIYRQISHFGGNPEKIFVVGHGSGANLCANLLTTNWKSMKIPPSFIQGGVVISGVYELYPLFLSSQNDRIKLHATDVVAYSPMRHLAQLHCPVIVVNGDKDSPEYQRQANTLAIALGGMGKLHKYMVLRSMNHFEVVTELNAADTDLSATILQMIRAA